MQIEAILVRTARPARTPHFDTAFHLSIQANTPREPRIHVNHVALKPVTAGIWHFRAPFLIVKPFVLLSYLAAL